MEEDKKHWLVKGGVEKARLKRAAELTALTNDSKQKKN